MCYSGFVCGILVQVASSGLSFPGNFALLALYAAPVTRYKMSRDIFLGFNGVFFWSISVPTDNVFQGWSKLEASYSAVDCVLISSVVGLFDRLSP